MTKKELIAALAPYPDDIEILTGVSGDGTLRVFNVLKSIKVQPYCPGSGNPYRISTPSEGFSDKRPAQEALVVDFDFSVLRGEVCEKVPDDSVRVGDPSG